MVAHQAADIGLIRTHARPARRAEAAHRLREREVSEPLGVLEQGTATFMIAGDRCTRACGFCAVTTARPLALEADEPARVAEASRRMGLKHVVITAVARDDLPDGGAEHFCRTIDAVRALSPDIVIEVLTPDFNDRDESIDTVLGAGPHIFNHNLETVRTCSEHRINGLV